MRPSRFAGPAPPSQEDGRRYAPTFLPVRPQEAAAFRLQDGVGAFLRHQRHLDQGLVFWIRRTDREGAQESL